MQETSQRFQMSTLNNSVHIGTLPNKATKVNKSANFENDYVDYHFNIENETTFKKNETAKPNEQLYIMLYT